MSVEGLEKERDFYFGKLRDIEVMCQDCDNGGDPPPIVQKILEVLYATEVIHIYIIILRIPLNKCFNLRFFFSRMVLHHLRNWKVTDLRLMMRRNINLFYLRM